MINALQFSNVLDLPVSMPQTRIPKGDSIIVAAYKLAIGQKIQPVWLSLHLLKTEGTPTKLVSSLGIAYCGIYANGAEYFRTPTGSLPLIYVSSDSVSSKMINPYSKIEIFGPDTVNVIVANNTSDTDLDISVIGCLRLHIYA